MIRKTLLTLAAIFTAGIVCAGPALASGSPGASAPITASGSVAATIGFVTPPSNLSFGAIVPGTEGTASTQWQVQSNDTNGFTVQIVPQSTAPAFTPDNNTLPDNSNWQVNGITAWRASQNAETPYVDDVSTLASSALITDNWGFNLPSTLYPSSFSEGFEYLLFTN